MAGAEDRAVERAVRVAKERARDDVQLLIAGIALSGVGGALLMPASMSLLTNVFTGARRGFAIGMWGAATELVSGIGVLVGGLLTGELSWRWIFIVNIVFAVVIVVLALRGTPESRDPNAPRPVPLFTFADNMEIPAGQTGGPALSADQLKPLGPNDRPAPKMLGPSVGAYVPGTASRIYPLDTAARLAAGSTLVFQMHYTTTGKPTTDRTSIGLVFAKERPKTELRSTALINGNWFVRKLKPLTKRAILMHGHRHVDWIGQCGDLTIVSAPSPVMEVTDEVATGFYIHTLAVGADGELKLFPPDWIEIPGDKPDAAIGEPAVAGKVHKSVIIKP